MLKLLKLFTPIFILLLVIGSMLILQERKTFDCSTLVHIDPVPHTEKLVVNNKYAEAEEYLSFFMDEPYVKDNPKAKLLLKIIQEKRSSYDYKTEKVLEGIVKGKSDEDIGRASAIASDFFVIGDVRDLSIQGANYANGKEVDNLIVALSSLGLLASATTLYSAGATAPIKTSISVLKYGKKVNKIPLWLQEKIIKYAKVAKETKSLDKITTLLQPISKMYNKVGLNQTLNILKASKNSKELLVLANFSSRFGKKSPILLLSTNNRALKYATAMPHVSTKSFIHASTYGEDGLKGLKKLGEAKFMKRVGFYANLSKTTYKGNLNSLFNYLLKNIPNSLLYTVVILGLLYFISKFYSLAKRLKLINLRWQYGHG